MDNRIPLRTRVFITAILVVSTWLFLIGFVLTVCRALGLT